MGVNVGVVDVGHGVKLGRGVAVVVSVIVCTGVVVEVLARSKEGWEGVV